MSNTKSTDSEQLEKVVRFLLGETMLDGMWFGGQDSSKPLYWWRTKLRAALQERDQQRLSAALEAVDDELIPVSHYTECLRLLHEDDATIPDDCSCGAELRMKQTLTAALGPDNSKIEE